MLSLPSKRPEYQVGQEVLIWRPDLHEHPVHLGKIATVQEYRGAYWYRLEGKTVDYKDSHGNTRETRLRVGFFEENVLLCLS